MFHREKRLTSKPTFHRTCRAETHGPSLVRSCTQVYNKHRTRQIAPSSNTLERHYDVSGKRTPVIQIACLPAIPLGSYTWLITKTTEKSIKTNWKLKKKKEKKRSHRFSYSSTLIKHNNLDPGVTDTSGARGNQKAIQCKYTRRAGLHTDRDSEQHLQHWIRKDDGQSVRTQPSTESRPTQDSHGWVCREEWGRSHGTK